MVKIGIRKDEQGEEEEVDGVEMGECFVSKTKSKQYISRWRSVVH